jgi:hypothetical protein
MRKAPIALGLFVVMLASGCGLGGPKNVLLKGKLTNGGKPVAADLNKVGVTLVFVPATESQDTYPATFNKDDNSYTVLGRDGKSGLPEGKYKVTLYVLSMEGNPTITKINEQLAVAKTPIEVEIKADNPNYDIDLAKYLK